MGFSDQDIDRLADDFIAEDRGEATRAFIGWAHHVRRAVAQAAHGAVDPARLHKGPAAVAPFVAASS